MTFLQLLLQILTQISSFLNISISTVSSQASDCHLLISWHLSWDIEECKQLFPPTPSSSARCSLFPSRGGRVCHHQSLWQMVNLWCMEFTPSRTEGSLRRLGEALRAAHSKREQAGAPAISFLPLIILLGSHYQPAHLNWSVWSCRAPFHACSLPACSDCPHYSSSQQRGIHCSMQKTDSLQPFAYSSKPVTTHRLCHYFFPPKLFDITALMNRGRNRGKEWNTNC